VRKSLDMLARHQHLMVTLLSVWLILTSPWVSMFSKIPRQPGVFDRLHVWIGLITLVLTITYSVSCLRNGGWRLYFPWLTGQVSQVGADLRGLFRARIPAAESGGLFGALEGLTLLALLATGVTGAGWLWAQGTSSAMEWRAAHMLLAHGLVVFVVLHTVAVALHVLDFIRE